MSPFLPPNQPISRERADKRRSHRWRSPRLTGVDIEAAFEIQVRPSERCVKQLSDKPASEAETKEAHHGQRKWMEIGQATRLTIGPPPRRTLCCIKFPNRCRGGAYKHEVDHSPLALGSSLMVKPAHLRPATSRRFKSNR